MPATSVLTFEETTPSLPDTKSDAPSVKAIDRMSPIDQVPQAHPEEDPPTLPAKGKDLSELKSNGKSRSKAAGHKDSMSSGGTASPSQSSSSYPQALPSHLTPHQSGYPPEYTSHQTQVTPEPSSPSHVGHVYDMNSILHQPTGYAPLSAQQYPTGSLLVPTPQLHPGQGQVPTSPSQRSVPPASPLFPRVTQSTAGVAVMDPNQMQDVAAPHSHASNGIYLSPALGPSGLMYPAMNSYASVMGTGSENGSAGEFSGWGDRNQISPYPQSSPQIMSQGMSIPFVPGMPQTRSVSVSSRSYSFGDESMLPPPAENQQQEFYSISQNNQAANGAHAGAVFAHQQAWGYAGPPPDMYGASASPLQPRPTIPYSMMGPPRHHGPSTMGAYGGQYYATSSPGPPIQTTASNKGPDGANLFIFHIPNHFSNLDMYQLFAPYGTLLSVRIMVEKESGRSRGFGFVSYDSPDSAALAIKELNGFAIGNKRLKVQHKQIRPNEQQHEKNQDSSEGYEGYRQDDVGSPHMNTWDESAPDTMVPNDASDMPQQDAAVTCGSDSKDPLSGFEPLRQALPEA